MCCTGSNTNEWCYLPHAFALRRHGRACCGLWGPCSGFCSKWAGMHGILFMQLQSDAGIIAAGRTRLCGALCIELLELDRVLCKQPCPAERCPALLQSLQHAAPLQNSLPCYAKAVC